MSHYQKLFQSLIYCEFAPSKIIVPHASRSSLVGRSNRRFSTNDVSGTDDALCSVQDPELGNNLFADDTDERGTAGVEGGAITF